MRGGALPAALLCAALAFALAFAPRRALVPALAAMAVAAFAATLLPLPKAWTEAIFLGCWASVLLAAAAVHLRRGIDLPLAVGLGVNTGVWAGATILVVGVPGDLLRALPVALLALPGQWLVQHRGGIAIKVAASWLIAVAVLGRGARRGADAGLCRGPYGMSVRAVGVASAVLLLAVPVRADVFEVAADGTVERLDTPPPPRAAPAAVRLRPGVAASARAAGYQPYVADAGQRYEVSPALIDAIAHVESRYDQAAVSPARAVGIMQLMPGTARDLGVDSRDPAANIRGGTAYLRMLLNRFDGDVVRTIAAYNAGPGAVSRSKGIPRYPETVAYVSRVLEHLAARAD